MPKPPTEAMLRKRWGQVLVCTALLSSAVAVRADQTCRVSPELRSSATANFEDLGDGTVLDRAHQLAWLRCPVGQTWQTGRCDGKALALDWQAAAAKAEELNRSGRLFFNDWRLPTLRELAMITERECASPRINLAVFPGTPSAHFWTSSARGRDTASTGAYTLSFGSEGVAYTERGQAMLVRLVRSAN